MRFLRIALVSLAAITLSAAPVQQSTIVPRADYHQHLFSPAVATLVTPPRPAAPINAIAAKDLIALLDAAGIQRALVLSVAYIFGQPGRNVDNEYEKVKAENDWTSQQVALFPNRLRAFCGLNPLKDYALTELARCAKDQNLRLHAMNEIRFVISRCHHGRW